MPQEAIAFAAPSTEAMTKTVTGLAGAGITGAVEGVVLSIAPKVGALEPIFTWGTLLGVPAIATAGALFTRGMLGDMFQGMACGGLGVVGYSLPSMLAAFTERRVPAGGQLGAGSVKLLGAGRPAYAPQSHSQSRAAVGLEF